MFPLGLLATGEKGEVMDTGEVNREPVGETANKSKSMCRVADMGLRAGNTIEVLNNEGGGPMLIRVDNSRLAIGRKIAMKIMVRRSAS